MNKRLIMQSAAAFVGPSKETRRATPATLSKKLDPQRQTDKRCTAVTA
jgi:hypothetical protein